MPIPDISGVAEGWVTFIAAIGLTFLGFIKIYEGDLVNGMGLITGGIGLVGLRRAVNNIPGKVADKAEVVAKTLAVKEEVHENQEMAAIQKDCK